MLHVRKVIEHVYEKVLGNDNSGNSNNHADKEQAGPPTEEELAELGALAEARVELLCHDQVGSLSVSCQTGEMSIGASGNACNLMRDLKVSR